MIKQDTIRAIVDSARVDEVVGEFVTLKKRGSNLIGLCPFHNEKTPSFTVSASKGIYKCFGCGKAGDSVRFVMEHDQLTYPEALRYLAGKYNIEIEETQRTEKDKEADNLRESLYLVNSFAQEHFKNSLWNDEAGKAIAFSYFMSRGFDEKTIEQFGLGYCKDEWDDFSKTALEKGYQGEFLEKTGLSIVKDGKYFDRFRGRVMFPIHNLSGRIIGFGGRTLKTDKKAAKYVNSPESEIYNKSRELYGLYFTKKDVVKEDFCYLVEGYTDVVSLYQSGIHNSAASSGTSLTIDQIKLIRRYTKNVVLLYDGDEAGLKATARAIDMLLEDGMNASVVVFPEGQDPDSYSKEHSDDELKKFLVENKKDFISFYLDHLAGDVGQDPVKKSELMKTIIGSISKIQDHLLRSLFIKDFAQKTKIEEQSAIFELNRVLKKDLKKRLDIVAPPEDFSGIDLHNQEAKEKFEISTETKEEKIIELLFKYGSDELSFPVNKEGSEEVVKMSVSSYIVGELERDQVQFRNEKYLKVYEVFRDKVDEDGLATQNDFLNHEDQDVRETCYNLVAEQHELSENWEKKYHIYTNLENKDLKASINRALYAIKLAEVMMRLTEFEEKMKEASDDDLIVLLKQQKMLSEAKKALAGKLGMTLH